KLRKKVRRLTCCTEGMATVPRGGILPQRSEEVFRPDGRTRPGGRFAQPRNALSSLYYRREERQKRSARRDSSFFHGHGVGGLFSVGGVSVACPPDRAASNTSLS